MAESKLSRMVHEIEEEVTLTRHLIGKDTLNPRVLDAMRKVPRDRFVPLESKAYAYENGPLPIGYGQTISQPYMVALMTDLLAPKPDGIVLEIGTGSCYQAAVLSLLVRRVYTVEIIPELAEQAKDRLMRLGYTNVEIRAGDGYYGWPDHAPYDGIIVTAAAPYLPRPLLAQLKAGGRMVIPIGLPYRDQEPMLVEKDEQGHIETRGILEVAFVPLTGDTMIELEREFDARAEHTDSDGERS
jgi:protein-L-isoaspartate(D-aspartate) O-methyltransferase